MGKDAGHQCQGRADRDYADHVRGNDIGCGRCNGLWRVVKRGGGIYGRNNHQRSKVARALVITEFTAAG